MIRIPSQRNQRDHPLSLPVTILRRSLCILPIFLFLITADSVTASIVTPVLHSFSRRQIYPKSISNRNRRLQSSPLDVLFASSTTVASSLPDASPATSESKQTTNIVVSLFTYVKDSVVRTATGCGQLYTNHQRCNTIRKKQSVFRAQLKEQWEQSGLYENYTNKQLQQLLSRQQGGISYEEYIFLQRGKEDRGKVLNMGFLMWGAPRILPYALMFNKNMLPSPFLQEDDAMGESWRRERTRAILNTLLTMENKMIPVPSNFFSNLFSSSSSSSAHETVRAVVTETSRVLSTMNGSTANARAAVAPLWHQWGPTLLSRTGTDFTRAEQRLCPVPPCIVQGLAQAVFGGGAGFWTQLTPAFLQRGKLVGHLEKIQAADEFLVSAQIDLTTIPKRLLQEACQDRLIDTGLHRSTQDLRGSLADWLYLTKKPLETGTDDDAPPVYYNGNLARLIVMAYYGCAAVRDAHSIGRLPQLLYRGNSTAGL